MTLIKVKSRGTDGVSGRKNLMINGDMRIAQRATSFTTPASSGQLLDRFSVLANSNGASKITYSQSTDTPPIFTNSIKLDVVSALTPASGDYHIMKYNGFEQQELDQLAWGTSSAKPVTLSFWVKSNKTGSLAAELQYNSVEASGASVELGKIYTINAANTWEHKVLHFPASTNHTSNVTQGSARGMVMYMWISGGSSYTGGSIASDWGVNTNRVSGLDNYLDSNSNEIYFTGFQLEVGDSATDFERRSFTEELTLCKRYYLKSRSSGFYNGDSDRGGEVSFRGDKPGSSSMFQWYQFPVEMRTRPTITTEGTGPNDLSSTLIGANGFRAGYNSDGGHYSFYYYAEAELS